MAWQQITVVTDEVNAPKVADLFSDLGALSVTYLDAEDDPVYEPAIGETRIWTNTQVVALYELDVDLQELKTNFFQRFGEELLQNWQEEYVADQPWERAWMEHYQPMKFAGKLWVCPTDQKRFENNTVCLVLDPGLAFGTGTHPTTALCLEWLASQDLRNKTIVDYGCGSGILAIAAVLLGAKLAYAVDIDPQALDATAMNAEKNQVEEKVIRSLPEQFRLKQIKADVVIANILAKPLIDMAEDITHLLEPGADLVLSGILVEQADSVAIAYQAKIKLNNRVQKEDWMRLSGTKY